MLPEYLKFVPTDSATDKKQILTVGDVRFSVLTSRLIRIERGKFTDDATLSVIDRNFSSPEFSAVRENGTVTITTDHLVLNYRENSDFSAETLTIRLKDKPYTEWHYGDKPLFNLGGTYETLDGRNGECPIGDGVCSVDGYALIDDSENPLIMQDGWFKKRDGGVTDFYFFGYGHDYTECVKDFYKLTGRPEMMPKFVFGNWWSRYYKYTEEEYLGLMDKFKAEDIPLSVAIVDMDWHLTDGDGRQYRADGWTGYTWNKEFFPDYKRFLKGIKDRNLHTALNLHPADGVRKWDSMYEQMAKAVGVDPKSSAPVPFNCLSDEFLKAYFEILHFPYEKDGVDFWWMDWQQGTDYNWAHRHGIPESELECITPLWILNHMHYMASKRDNKRGLIFSRYSGHGSQRYPLGFSGDTHITWDSLDFQPYFTVTASNVGYGWWSHDIGGHYCGARDDELNARWVQFGVFSPIFRMHSSNNPFTSREPWAYGKQCELAVTKFMRLRHQLFPYIYTMSYRNYNELIPLIRPMYHLYPEQKEAYGVRNEYMFGSELLVAPITAKADDVTRMGHSKVWLPEGKWIDWFTGYVYGGGKTTDAYRKFDEMPLFLKAGAIVPLQSHRPHDNTLGGGELEIVIAAGADNEFVLYEDDGETVGYKNGAFATTKMRLDWAEDKATFTVFPAQGDTSVIPEKRDIKLVFKGFMPDTLIDGSNDGKTVVLNGVSTNKGISVTLKREGGLMFDDGDVLKRCLDIITGAQCSNQSKKYIYERVCSAFDGKSERMTMEGYNELGRALYEIAREVQPKAQL